MKRLMIAMTLAVAGTMAASQCRAEDKDVVCIGIPKSLFRELPPALISFSGQPFKDLIKVQSGLKGEVVHETDWAVVAQKVDNEKFQLGVFQGHEFAWARAKNPKLQPLVCSVPRPKEMQAFLLVRHDSKAGSVSDLKGAKLALAGNVRDHVRLFLANREAAELKGGGFAETDKTETVHDAIHKVMDGEAEVTAVDSASWSYFQKLYPGPCQNLRVLAQSDVFPATTLAYKTGAVSEATLKALRDGLTTAHLNSKAARMMSVIRVDRFDEVPKNYDDMLKACLKTYPKPIAFK